MAGAVPAMEQAMSTMTHTDASTGTAQKIFARVRELRLALQKSRGTIVAIACERGQFCVTETKKVGRRWETKQLTGMQSHAECVEHMEAMVAGGAA